MFTVNQKARLNGIYVDGCLFEPYNDELQMQGVYSCIIQPHEGCVDLELSSAFETEVGWHSRLDNSSWLTPDGYLRFESLVKPFNGFGVDEVRPGSSLRIGFKPVINYTPDHELAYGQLQMIGFDPIEEDVEIDWDTCEGVDI